MKSLELLARLKQAESEKLKSCEMVKDEGLMMKDEG